MREFLSWRAFAAEHGWRAAPLPAEHGAPGLQLTGPPAAAAAPFSEAVPSWVADTPAGSWIELQLRAGMDERWTAFYRIARWDGLAEHSRRSSFGPQRDAIGRVATDTLVLAEPATQIQARVLLYGAPVLQRLALALSGPGDAPMAMPAPAPAELPVPPRAQLDYPNGPNICSPTALAMVLAYWHARTGDARLAPFAERRAVAELTTPQVYDPLYEGHGNWGFNTAYAGSLGLDAYVARFGGIAELVPWLAAGVPVVISVAWQPGELANAPIASSRGHLLIVAGFDRHGQVIVADPRGEREAEVRRIYDAGQLERAWQHNSAGTAYLIHPRGWSVPAL